MSSGQGGDFYYDVKNLTISLFVRTHINGYKIIL